MRVAYFLQAFPDPFEHWIYNQMEPLLTRGNEIHIWSLMMGEPTSQNHVISRFDLMNHLTALNHARRGVLHTSAQLATLFLKRPSSAIAILRGLTSGNTTQKIRMALLFDDYWRLRSEYDVVYASKGDMAIDCLPMVLGSRARFIVGFLGGDLFRHSSASYRPVFERADAVLAPSRYCQQRLTALGCNPTKIIDMPFGVDLNLFRYVKRPERQPNEKLKLISVGRLSKEKGFRFGIDAVAKLCNDYNLVYTIVGEGPSRSKLQSRINELGLQDRIFLPGIQDQETLAKTLQDSHICIAPSITTELGQQESYGMMIREAAATGCPVIASNIGGLVDGVIPEKTGLLVPEKDVDALAQAIVSIISRDSEWVDMGLNARRLMQDTCDLAKMNERFAHLVEGLVPHTGYQENRESMKIGVQEYDGKTY